MGSGAETNDDLLAQLQAEREARQAAEADASYMRQMFTMFSQFCSVLARERPGHAVRPDNEVPPGLTQL